MTLPGEFETGPGDPVDPAGSEEDVGWQQLSRLTLAVTAGWMGLLAVGGAVILLITGVWPWLVLPAIPVVVGAGVGVDYLRWSRTSYRLTAERLELRSGILVRSYRSTPRDRIRSVDVTADLVYRIFGVAVVKVGTGQHASADSGELKLDPLPTGRAEELRTTLLRRAAAAGGAPMSDGVAGADQEALAPTGAAELARLDPRWVRYAPLSILTPILGGGAVGAMFQVAGWFDMLPWQLGLVQPMISPFREVPLPVAIATAVVAFLVVGAVGALAVWVETWWGFRLERDAGVFRVRRGLLTRRSISLEEARLRGLELVEPLPLRGSAAGHLHAVATGMSSSAEKDRGAPEKKALLPAAPLPVVHEVSASVLDIPEAPAASADLRPHPWAARRRRLVWALSGVTVPSAVLVGLGLLLTDELLWVALGVAVVGLAGAPVLAFDAYRNLGHALHGRFAVLRHGTFARRTVALQRSGIIGWKVRQTYFQRRAGLATVTATTAAGAGRYSAYDVDLGAGLAYAAAAVPDLLAPFLLRSEDGPDGMANDPGEDPEDG